jgi:hypothetical protein
MRDTQPQRFPREFNDLECIEREIYSNSSGILQLNAQGMARRNVAQPVSRLRTRYESVNRYIAADKPAREMPYRVSD